MAEVSQRGESEDGAARRRGVDMMDREVGARGWGGDFGRGGQAEGRGLRKWRKLIGTFGWGWQRVAGFNW